MSRVLLNSENRISCAYGPYKTTNPALKGKMHNGVDIAPSTNEEENKVYANCKGVVYEIQDGLDRNVNATGKASWGNFVLVKHPNGMFTRYAHLQKGTIAVKVGEEVDENTYLGIMGESGVTFGRHLHYEVATRYSSTTRIDPTPYLTKAVYEENPQNNNLLSLDEIAKEVIDGKWGNGQDRFNKLDAAGYNSAEVQNRVNEMVYNSQPSSSFNVGDNVKIIATGNSQASGKGGVAKGINYCRKVLKIYEGYAFPYQIGNETGTTGFYKAEALQKI